jgi:hypothetical protein
VITKRITVSRLQQRAANRSPTQAQLTARMETLKQLIIGLILYMLAAWAYLYKR